MARHLIDGPLVFAVALAFLQPQTFACPIDDVVRELRADLQSEVESTRIDAVASACELMASQASRAQAESLLLLAIQDKSGPVRFRSAVTLSDYEYRDARIREVLLGAIGSADSAIAVRSAHALAAVDPQNPAIRRRLLAALEKPPYNPFVVPGLLRTEPSSCKEAVLVLRRTLEVEDAPQAEIDRVARYSADLGLNASSMVPILLAKLDAEQGDTLLLADAFCSIGPEASSAGPTLVARWEAGSDRDRIRLATAISSIGDACTPYLLRCLDRADANSRYRIIQLLGNTRGECPRAVAALSHLADQGDVSVRAAAIVAISSLGPRAKDAVKVLFRHMDDQSVVTDAKQLATERVRFQPIANEGSSIGMLSVYAIGMVGNATALRQLELAIAQRPQVPEAPNGLGGPPRDEKTAQLLSAISRIKKRQKESSSEELPKP